MRNTTIPMAFLLVCCFAGCISYLPEAEKQTPQHENIALVFFDKLQNAIHSRPHRLAPDVTVPGQATRLSQNFRDGTEYNVTYRFLSRAGKADVWEIVLEMPSAENAIKRVKYKGNTILLYETDEIRIELR